MSEPDLELEEKRLLFYVNVYFAIFPQLQTGRKAATGTAMEGFRTFLETEGATLAMTAEFIPFYALPCVLYCFRGAICRAAKVGSVAATCRTLGITPRSHTCSCKPGHPISARTSSRLYAACAHLTPTPSRQSRFSTISCQSVGHSQSKPTNAH